MVIQIDYDLNKTGQNYSGLIKKIEALGTSYAKPCKSCWLVATRKSPTEAYNELRPLIDDNDRLLISRFSLADHRGWLDNDVVAWLDRLRTSMRDLS